MSPQSGSSSDFTDSKAPMSDCPWAGGGVATRGASAASLGASNA